MVDEPFVDEPAFAGPVVPEFASASRSFDRAAADVPAPVAASSVTPDDGALDRSDPNQPRIPVFDLDRLRAWLTDENVRLGRIAVVSVEIDNLSYVNERLGYRAGAHLIEAITQRLRSVTRPARRGRARQPGTVRARVS